MRKYALPLLLTLLLTGACNKKEKQLTLSGLDPARFEATNQRVRDTVTDNLHVGLYTLKNEAGMEVCITNYGGRIVSIMVPDRNGSLRDVVLGFDNLEDYMTIPSDFGAAIGRYANRIDHGRFVLNGDTVQLPINNDPHTLHGGPQGWQYQVYEAHQLDDQTLELTMDSPDGDMNFPGHVIAKVVYRLTKDNAIDMQYCATTDKPTIINMTNHSYFNLSGDPSQPATDHLMYINAAAYTPCDSTFMTTGEILPVEGTPMDFRTPKPMGQDIEQDFVQLKNGRGYDHNWVLATNGDIKQLAASLYSPASGIKLEVYTNEPGLQVYTGNFLDGNVTGKHGIAYPFRASVCMESQHYPDSPNKPQWPSVVLNPGQTYESECIFKFSVEKK